jgi:hypothetical protein
MEEFLQSASGVLSEIQIEIVKARVDGMKWRDIEVSFGLSGQNAISHCIRNTALGYRWEPGYAGGANPYLSAIDEVLFQDILENAAVGLNCITTVVARSVAHSLREHRQKIAIDLLHLWKNGALINNLAPVEQPS